MTAFWACCWAVSMFAFGYQVGAYVVERRRTSPISGACLPDGPFARDLSHDDLACRECGNDHGPYDGLCLDCLEDAA